MGAGRAVCGQITLWPWGFYLQMLPCSVSAERPKVVHGPMNIKHEVLKALLAMDHAESRIV